MISKIIRGYTTQLKGLAIIYVILFHLWCATKNELLAVFQYGFSGVDLFMIISGFGLAYSWNKNTSKSFYLKRFFRIYPLFFVYYTIKYVLLLYMGEYKFQFTDLLAVWTTLNYYGYGCVEAGWYLCTMLLLYAIYPLLYKLTNKINVLILTLAVCIFLYRYQLPWDKVCAIARLPIFTLGILLGKASFENRPHRVIKEAVINIRETQSSYTGGG